MGRRDIPLQQAIELVRAAQKLNCDTAEQLHKAMSRRISDLHVEMNRRITAERALERIMLLPKTSDIKTAQHFARLGLPKSWKRKQQ